MRCNLGFIHWIIGLLKKTELEALIVKKGGSGLISDCTRSKDCYRVYGKKIKQIAKETGHSKNTIKKVLRGEYTGYKPRVQQPYPILGVYLK
jgi:hypothetical protein